MIAEVPVIETARLRLRGHRSADFGDCAAMWADPGVVRHIGGRPFPAEEVWAKILRYAGLWSLLGYGYWAIEEKASGRYVGDVGFADFKRDVRPSFDGAPEIGWGDGYFAAARTVCMIDPENAASIRVAEKCGYREFGRTLYKNQATILFQREGRVAR